MREMTTEQIEEVLRDLDWTEVHKMRVFSGYGDSVVIYTDATFSMQDSSTYYRDPDASGVLGYLSCWGRGNIDRTAYYEGWRTPNEHGEYTILPEYADLTGRPVLTFEEMIEEAIEEGDWDYEEEIEELARRIEEERDVNALAA